MMLARHHRRSRSTASYCCHYITPFLCPLSPSRPSAWCYRKKVARKPHFGTGGVLSYVPTQPTGWRGLPGNAPPSSSTFSLFVRLASARFRLSRTASAKV